MLTKVPILLEVPTLDFGLGEQRSCRGNGVSGSGCRVHGSWVGVSGFSSGSTNSRTGAPPSSGFRVWSFGISEFTFSFEGHPHPKVNS